MKSKLFFLGAASLLLASCSNELDLPTNMALDGSKAPLCVNVLTSPTTKALFEGTTLPGGSKIGVKLVKSDGTNYDNQPYNNIYYSTTDGATWTIDATKSILLSSTEGKAYAYFPYVENASLDFTAIPIESANDPTNQTDYMFGNEASGLKNSNATASFTMSHAMSIVNFEIKKGSYTGTGAITAVKMSGNTASNTGTMNAEAGTVAATNAGYEFTSTNSLTLGNSSTGKFIVVPSGSSSKLDFKVTMDGQTYTASTAAVELENGQVYKYTLTMNSTGLTVSQVTVTPWGEEQDKGAIDTELYKTILTWEEAKTKDGVYGMMADGNAMVYEAAATTSESLTGVAFVIKGKAYQVAKVDATGYDGAASVYWQKNDYSDISGLENFSKADGTNGTGYLAGSLIPQLSQDPATWTAGALSDFNGQTNTVTILAAQSDGTLDYTIGKAVMDFRNGSNNEGYTDWFIPSCGELAFMFLKKTELNTLLGKVSGSAFSSSAYWSSSEYGSAGAWRVNFSHGYVDYYYGTKDTDIYVRLVRAI